MSYVERLRNLSKAGDVLGNVVTLTGNAISNTGVKAGATIYGIGRHTILTGVKGIPVVGSQISGAVEGALPTQQEVERIGQTAVSGTVGKVGSGLSQAGTVIKGASAIGSQVAERVEGSALEPGADKLLSMTAPSGGLFSKGRAGADILPDVGTVGFDLERKGKKALGIVKDVGTNIVNIFN